MELNAYLDDERRRILGAASAERREQMTRAEQSRTVYRAWNAVCGGTREGAHVTGLRYLPDTNELLVYLDAPSWTQEMSMLREIIRARMEREGVSLAGFKFRTTKPGHVKSHVSRQPSSGSQANGAARSQAAVPPARAPLSAEEDAALDVAVSPISDQKLAAALKKAMKASLEWKKANQ